MEKPKILSVKLGYNPNSSSLGIAAKIFLWGSLVVSIVFSFIGVFILTLAKKKK